MEQSPQPAARIGYNITTTTTTPIPRHHRYVSRRTTVVVVVSDTRSAIVDPRTAPTRWIRRRRWFRRHRSLRRHGIIIHHHPRWLNDRRKIVMHERERKKIPRLADRSPRHRHCSSPNRNICPCQYYLFFQAKATVIESPHALEKCLLPVLVTQQHCQILNFFRQHTIVIFIIEKFECGAYVLDDVGGGDCADDMSTMESGRCCWTKCATLEMCTRCSNIHAAVTLLGCFITAVGG